MKRNGSIYSENKKRIDTDISDARYIVRPFPNLGRIDTGYGR